MATTHSPESLPVLLTAIGRPLDPAWKEHFADVARSILPTSVELRMRKVPGVVYVPGGTLSGRSRLEADDEDDRHLRLQQYSHAMIASLCDGGRLNKQAAVSTLDLSLHKPKSISRKHPRASGVALVVELDDVPNSSLEGYAYQVQGERDAFIDKFRIDDGPVSARQQPKYRMAVGIMTGFTPHENLIELGQALREPVPLLGIDALNMALES